MSRNQQLALVWPDPASVAPYHLSPQVEGLVDREIDRWLEEDVKVRFKSRDTWRGKQSQAHMFRDWCLQRGILRVQEITRDSLRDYFIQSRERGYALSSLRTRSAILRSWLTWLVDEGLIPRVPRFDTPTPDRKLPRRVEQQHIEAILDACNDGTGYGARDRAIILTLYGAGCRVSEVAKLNVDDLELERSRARVHGKGSRSRIVALTPPAVEALRAYLARFRMLPAKPKDLDALFTTRVGTRMGREMIRVMVKRRGEAAGIPWIHPHLFRHAAATHLLDAGADIRHVQEVMGHVSITSTQLYTQVSVERMAETVARYHPHAVKPTPGPNPSATPSSSTPDPSAAPDRR